MSALAQIKLFLFCEHPANNGNNMTWTEYPGARRRNYKSMCEEGPKKKRTLCGESHLTNAVSWGEHAGGPQEAQVSLALGQRQNKHNSRCRLSC